MSEYDVGFVAALIVGGLAACSGGSPGATNPQADAGAPDASDVQQDGADAASDAGASTTYPAFTPDLGQIVTGGGYVMKNPVIVPITWNADPAQAAFDAFTDSIGATAYWAATTKEYGVGAATGGTHAHVATAVPATLQDADLHTMITTNAGAAGGWPAATADTIYAFFLPPGTSLLEATPGGGAPQDSCQQGFGGYHDQIAVGGVTAAYAVVPSCDFGKGAPEQQTMMSIAHELIESATNPQPSAAKTGYVGFDSDHFAWDYFQELQSEVGDACEFYRSAFYEDKETSPTPFDGWVQRSWSNAAAKAGHDPCVPAASHDPYFSVTPIGLTDVGYEVPGIFVGQSGSTTGRTKGVLAAAGASATFTVGFYSDGPTSGPWTIAVVPGNPLLKASFVDQYNASTVTATIDAPRGRNGDVAHVTVNVAKSGSLFKGEIVTIVSTLNGVSHYAPVWIASAAPGN
jgi:hypothetical protein